MEQNEILEETRRTNELLRGQLLWMRAAAALLGLALWAWHALLALRGGRTLHGDAGHGLVLVDPLPTVPPAQALAASGIWVPSGYWLRHDRPFSF